LEKNNERLKKCYEDGPYITKNDRIVELENKIQQKQISMLIEESAFHERMQKYNIISKENTQILRVFKNS